MLIACFLNLRQNKKASRHVLRCNGKTRNVIRKNKDMRLTFEWDENKAKLNFDKHKVSFEEAKTVFDDPFLMTFPDSEHSNYEQRYINIGISSRSRFLVVIHTEREENIRIISCRKATKSERKFYEESI